MEKRHYITLGIVIIVLILMINPFLDNIRSSRLKENNCLEEEMYYYRFEGWFLPSKIDTTEINSDGYDYRCIKWEQTPSPGKIIFGQKLIYEKGKLNNTQLLPTKESITKA